jgi:hypothetical protein
VNAKKPLITVYQDADPSTLGEDTTKATLDGYCENLSARLEEQFPDLSFMVVQTLGSNRRAHGHATDAQLDAVEAFVRDLTGGDGWIDLVPGDVANEGGES